MVNCNVQPKTKCLAFSNASATARAYIPLIGAYRDSVELSGQLRRKEIDVQPVMI